MSVSFRGQRSGSDGPERTRAHASNGRSARGRHRDRRDASIARADDASRRNNGIDSFVDQNLSEFGIAGTCSQIDLDGSIVGRINAPRGDGRQPYSTTSSRHLCQAHRPGLANSVRLAALQGPERGPQLLSDQHHGRHRGSTRAQPISRHAEFHSDWKLHHCAHQSSTGPSPALVSLPPACCSETHDVVDCSGVSPPPVQDEGRNCL